MIVAIGVLLIFIAGLFVWKNFDVPGIFSRLSLKNETVKTPVEVLPDLGPTKEENKKLINNPGALADTITVGNSAAVVITPGTNPVSVETGEVLAKTGEVAKNNAQQGGLDSITQSFAVDPAKLSENTIKLAIASGSISPKEFTVHPGQAVSLAVTNNVSWSEIIIFADPALRAIGFSLMPKETRTITFNAPMKTGDYLFYSDIAAERANGLEGKMVVK